MERRYTETGQVSTNNEIMTLLGVSNGLCEHPSTAFFYASTSIEVSLAINEHFQKSTSTKNRACEHLHEQTSTHPLEFCENFEQKPNFASTAKF